MPPKKTDAQAPARKYKGVYKSKGAWRARIWDLDHEIYLGHFREDSVAGTAYDTAAIKCAPTLHRLHSITGRFQRRLAAGMHASGL